ncbi:MAG: glycosyltransferase [Anaerolineae bacterium]|nr:glycosyltransferase [Anaerolineae bacterium]
MSVIIPCYNQGRFLSEAIESVLQQTYREFEIVVVDDGSTDHSSEVAARFPGVRIIRQENRGLPAARNTGLEQSSGWYVVFLDADDRLLPVALASNLACLRSHPDCAFAAGQYRMIAVDGTALAHCPEPFPQRDHYVELLRGNAICLPAAVLYRRDVLDSMGGFGISASLKGCEDYDLYLRIAREFQIVLHDVVVAEYRQHPTSMSRNAALMLASFQAALRAQLPTIKGNKRYEETLKMGIKKGQEAYGLQLAVQVRDCLETRAWDRALMSAWALLRLAPRVFVQSWRYVPGEITRWLNKAIRNKG